MKFAVGDYKYWPEDLSTFTFYDFYENIVQLKHNETFKIFDEQTNSWKYFKFFIKDGRHFYKPIEYWFTKKRYFNIYCNFYFNIIFNYFIL